MCLSYEDVIGESRSRSYALVGHGCGRSRAGCTTTATPGPPPVARRVVAPAVAHRPTPAPRPTPPTSRSLHVAPVPGCIMLLTSRVDTLVSFISFRSATGHTLQFFVIIVLPSRGGHCRAPRGGVRFALDVRSNPWSVAGNVR